jgi:hypothetical protein
MAAPISQIPLLLATFTCYNPGILYDDHSAICNREQRWTCVVAHGSGLLDTVQDSVQCVHATRSRYTTLCSDGTCIVTTKLTEAR